MGEKFKEVCGQGESRVCGMCEEGREKGHKYIRVCVWGRGRGRWGGV